MARKANGNAWKEMARKGRESKSRPGSQVGKSFPAPRTLRSALPNVERGRRERKQRGNELSCLHNGGVGELSGSWVGAR